MFFFPSTLNLFHHLKMSLERTPQRSTVPPSLTSGLDPVNLCSVCTELLDDTQDCVIIQECCHVFHRICIETSLQSSSSCPVCKRACQLNELRKYPFQSSVIPNTEALTPNQSSDNPRNPLSFKPSQRGKPRGAKAHHYKTRSQARSICQDGHNNTQDNSLYSAEPVPLNQTNLEELPPPNSTQAMSPCHVNTSDTNVDYHRINRMIEQNLARVLGTLNLLPHPEQNHVPIPGNDSIPNPQDQNSNRTQVIQNGHVHTQMSGGNPNSHIQYAHVPQYAPYNTTTQANIGNAYRQNPSSPLTSAHGPNPNELSNHSYPVRLPFAIDKITSIVQNWNLKFDGSQNGLDVDEFLYRVRSLTFENFNGDFTLICKNLQMLLSGNAKRWFWRYHKQVQLIEWDDFCEAIRSQYQNCKTAFDLREEIRNRRQKPGETFEAFIDAVSTIIDKLPSPMSETELIEVLTRNLRPEIRQDLLYVSVHSISHLRKLVQKREHFLSDEHVRRNLTVRGGNVPGPRRLVAEIDGKEEMTNESQNEKTDLSVNALVQPPRKPKCWNCDDSGHNWEDCLQERRVFCYGCGAIGVYKPNCDKCRARKLNSSKNLPTVVPLREQP